MEDIEEVMERTGADFASDFPMTGFTRSVNEIECIEKLREKFRAVKEPRKIFGPSDGDYEDDDDDEEINDKVDEGPRRSCPLTSQQMKIYEKVK